MQHRPSNRPELLDQSEAAEFLGLSENTLMSWRSRKMGPAYHNLGEGKKRRIKYDVRDLIAYLESRKVRPSRSHHLILFLPTPVARQKLRVPFLFSKEIQP